MANIFDQRGQTVGVQVNGRDSTLKIEILRLSNLARQALQEKRYQDVDQYLAQIERLSK